MHRCSNVIYFIPFSQGRDLCYTFMVSSPFHGHWYTALVCSKGIFQHYLTGLRFGVHPRSAHVLILRRLRDAACCSPQETMLEEEGRSGRLHPRSTLRSLKLWIGRGSFGLFVFGVPWTPATPDPKFSKSPKTPSKTPSFTLCKYTCEDRCCHITVTLASSIELCLGGVRL